MICEIFYIDDSISGFYLFLIGLLIGLVIILLVWLIVLRSRFLFRIKISDTSHSVNFTKKIDKRKLIDNNPYFMVDEEEKQNGYFFIFYNNFDKWKSIHRNYINVINHIDDLNLFSVNESTAREDLMIYNDLEFHHRNERVSGNTNLHQQLLNDLLQKGRINSHEHKVYTENREKKYKDAIDGFNSLCDSYLNSIRTTAPKNTTATEMQQMIDEKLPRKADELADEIINNQSEDIRDTLQKVLKSANTPTTTEQTKSGQAKNEQIKNPMSNDDINKIFSRYLEKQQKMETFLSNNKASLNKRFDERLLLLKASINKEVIEDDVQKNYDKEREKAFIVDIEKNITDLSETEKNRIINDYRNNYNAIKDRYRSDLKIQQLALSKKIEDARKKDLEQMFFSSEKDLSKHSQIGTLDQSDDDEYQKLKDKIDEKALDIIKTSDTNLSSETQDLKEISTQSIEYDISEMEDQFLKKLYYDRGVSSLDISEILREHAKNVKGIKKSMGEEKLRQIKKMKELMDQKQKKNIVDLSDACQSQLEAENKKNLIFSKVMDDQLDLSNEIKTKIIKDSKSNEVNIKNQLFALKIRQQKQLDLALARKMCSNEELAKTVGLSASLIQVEAFEIESKRVELDKEAMLSQMRDRLVNETKAILSQYEDQMCHIMAIYQVSHARELRKKKNLKSCYDNLQKEMSRPAYEQNPIATEQVLEQFSNDCSHLENMKSDIQNEQKIQLEKKLEEAKHKVARQKEGELKRRFTDQIQSYKESGVSEAALQIADTNLVDKMEKEIEREVKLELNEYIEDSEKTIMKYDADLEQNLLDKKKDIISQLVSITNMTNSELSDKIEKIDPNMDQETKRAIINDIKRKDSKIWKEKSFYLKTDREIPENRVESSEQVDDENKRKKKKKRKKIREPDAENEF